MISVTDTSNALCKIHLQKNNTFTVAQTTVCHCNVCACFDQNCRAQYCMLFVIIIKRHLQRLTSLPSFRDTLWCQKNVLRPISQ